MIVNGPTDIAKSWDYANEDMTRATVDDSHSSGGAVRFVACSGHGRGVSQTLVDAVGNNRVAVGETVSNKTTQVARTSPPFTSSIAPVMYVGACMAKNITTSQISLSRPSRPTGIDDVNV